MATTTEDLAERIERLVREHLAESRRRAQEAVARAFSSSMPASSRRKRRASCDTTKAVKKRRTPAEMAAMCERLYRAVCAHPGEPIGVLVEHVGASARELYRPMNQLKDAGRIRSVGSRNHTRYFPMTTDAASA